MGGYEIGEGCEAWLIERSEMCGSRLGGFGSLDFWIDTFCKHEMYCRFRVVQRF